MEDFDDEENIEKVDMLYRQESKHNGEITYLPPGLIYDECVIEQLIKREEVERTGILSIAERKLSNLMAISHLTWLTKLDCSYCGLTSLAGIEGLSALTELNCAGNQLTSLEGLENLNSLTTLNCGRNKLTSLAGIENLTALTMLNCGRNKLTSLAGIENLTALIELYCVRNKLTSLAGTENLNALATLNCSENQLTSLAGIENLTALIELYCHQNQLINLAGLKNLNALATLNCGRNKLTSLAGIENLNALTTLNCHENQLINLAGIENLTTLATLNCGRNKLTSLAGIENLTALTMLNCGRNKLTSLAGIENLTALIELYCVRNKLTSLAGTENLNALATLNCSENQLTSLAGIENLAALTNLECSSNQFNNIDSIEQLENLQQLLCFDNRGDFNGEILSANYRDNCLPRVRDWFAARKFGMSEFAQSKVFLLGNGTVGKTQLARRLFGKDYDSKIKSTHGIMIEADIIKTASEDHESIIENKVMLWDFGGQDIYHSTHSMFLSKSKAVFVICWNEESENNREHKADGKVFRNYPIQYWVEYVRRIAGKDAPIILAETKCDDGKPGKYHADLPKNTNPIAEICFSACGPDENKPKAINLGQVKSAIGKAIEQNKAKNNAPMPKGYVRVIEHLRGLLHEIAFAKANGDKPKVQTLTQAEFAAICHAEEDGVSPVSMLDLVHKMGLVFYRKGLFNDEIILDQQWALDAIYSIFDRENTYPQIIKNNGRLTLNDLALSVWIGRTSDEMQLFLSMTEQCKIAFPYYRRDGVQTYIAPDLLSNREDVELFIKRSWNEEAPTIALELNFPLLHSGVMREVICRIGSIAGFDATFWKNGIFFYDSNTDAICLVEQTFEGNGWTGKIRISAQKRHREVLAKKVADFIESIAKSQGLEPIKAKPAVENIAFDDIPDATDEKFQNKTVYLDVSRDDFVDKPIENLPFTPAKDPDQKPLYYISYKRDVKEDEVISFYNKLKSAGMDVLMDKYDIEQGADFWEFMKKMGDGQVFLFFSSEYFRSLGCMYELCRVRENVGVHLHKVSEKAKAFLLENIELNKEEFSSEIAAYWKNMEEKFDWQKGHDTDGNALIAVKSFADTFLKKTIGYLMNYQLFPSVDDFAQSAINSWKEKNK